MSNEEIMALRLGRVEEDVDEIKHAVTSISESLRTLASLAVHQEQARDGLARAFNEISAAKADYELRIRNIEKEMPVILAAVGIIKKVVMWTLAAIVAAMLALIVNVS